MNDIMDFVLETKDKINAFREKNPEENLYTLFLELNEKNLDIICKFKKEYDESKDDEDRKELADMMMTLKKSVSDSLSIIDLA